MLQYVISALLHLFVYWLPSGVINNIIVRHRWQAISPIGNDVTVPSSVCLSVCHVRALCSNGKKYRDYFLHYTRVHVSPTPC